MNKEQTVQIAAVAASTFLLGLISGWYLNKAARRHADKVIKRLQENAKKL